MATRSIVTSQPDIACDVCGRRLLRGEQSDVFLASGRRRTVCELCAPRASHEGWLRETDAHSVSLPPARPRRGRSLFDRWRQQRWPAPDRSAPPPGEIPATGQDPGEMSYDFFDGGPSAAAPDADGAEAGQAAAPGQTGWSELDRQDGVRPAPVPVAAPAGADPGTAPIPADGALRSGDVKAARSLAVFNAGEHPRRVAGVARSLGAPSVSVRPLAESGSEVAIVVAWELCWYRYEVDLGDEAAGASVTAQGTELDELAAEDRLANATATADGTLSLLGSVVG
jgi:hypothetical protein